MGVDRIRANDLLIGSANSDSGNGHGPARGLVNGGHSILAKRHHRDGDQLNRTLRRRFDRAIVNRAAVGDALGENTVVAILL